MGKYEILNWSGEKAKQFGHAGRLNEPYELAEGQEAAVCQECHAIYQEKRWFFDAKLFDKLAGAGKVRQVVCPTCRKIKDHYVEGYLTLSGEFLVEHKNELVILLENEAAKVGKRNVGDRIIQMAPEGEKLVVETTTDKLAQHLGRAIYKAYKGELTFNWGERDKLVRVYWSR
ncbi:MAG: BCAM0308 family protein [Deltaproteobacteria bacterium]|nr:BCAM0308 family protein [Deltaproteobacteria bacterium]